MLGDQKHDHQAQNVNHSSNHTQQMVLIRITLSKSAVKPEGRPFIICGRGMGMGKKYRGLKKHFTAKRGS